MAEEKKILIPGRLKNIAVSSYLAGASDIIDDSLGKSQQEINAEVTSTEEDLDTRLNVVEQLAEISVAGGEIGIATANDLKNRTTAGDAKIPTVAAVMDSADDTPAAGSTNWVTSGGVYSGLQDIRESITTLKDVTELAGRWTNRFLTSYVTFELDESGHNGTWHLLKKYVQSAVIRMNLSQLTNGKIYHISFNVQMENGLDLCPISGSVDDVSALVDVRDYYSKQQVIIRNGQVSIDVEKVSDWNYLYLRYGIYNNLTYPLDVVISDFNISEVVMLKDTVEKLLSFDETVSKELGNVVLAEGSGTSSTTGTVDYIPWTTLGYTLPLGTKLYVEVEGVGSGQSVSKLRLFFNGSTSAKFISKTTKILLDEDVTKIRVASIASETSYSGDVSVSIRYVGTTIESLQESIAATNERIDETNVELTSLDTDIHGIDEFELDSYEGTPRAYSGNPVTSSTLYITNPTLPNSTKPLVIGGNLEISVEGIGSAIKEYVVRINNDVKKTRGSLLTIPVTETINSINLYTTSAQIKDSSQQISVSIKYKYDSLVERLDNSKGSTYDFDTNFIVDKFATDKENNEFTNSFTFSINGYAHAHKNMIVTAYAMFVNDIDDSIPTIQFKYLYGNTVIHASTAYTIGKKDEYCKKKWRVPAFMDNCSVQVVVTIPSNVTLYIGEFTNYYSDTINRNTVGYRMNAHLSFYNFNTLNAWDESAKLGYPCAIVVPKRTSDGVWVCFHDDSLSTQLIDANGNTPADNHPGETLAISSLTYSELQTYTYKENNFGEYLKVAKLEDFFMVCAKTGMHPMFSWHPVSSAEEMQEIKAMAKKFGLLPYLNIKMAFSGGSNVSALDIAYSVFGSEIESYTGDVNVDTDISTIITSLDTTNAAQNKDKVRVGLELFNSRLGNDTSKVQAILDAGYFVAIAWMTADPTGEQLEYWIRNGVTEFTEYNMVSYGLNW